MNLISWFFSKFFQVFTGAKERRMSVRIGHTAKGGGNEIGASNHLYDFNGEIIGVDCGMRPTNFNSDIRHEKICNTELSELLDEILVRPEVNPLPNLDTTSRINNLLVTHGHFDHVGAVPYWLRTNRDMVVWMTPVTAELCQIQWLSTPRIAEIKKQVPLFTEADAFFALSRIKLIDPGQCIRINDRLEIEPVEAGHLLGAVSFIFYWDGVPVGFHTGDFTLRNNQQTVADAPEVRFDHLRFMTTESTRITEKNPPRHLEDERFDDTIREAYDNKMKIRILTFAIGRIQEMFIRVKRACPDADIYIDGQGRDVSRIYAEHTNGILDGVEKHFINDKVERLSIIRSDKPNIVLAPSAMQFGGLSRQYIERACGSPEHLIISTGYRDPRSPEYAFFASDNHNDVFRFGAYTSPRMCETATFNFTGHCDGDDILEMKARMNPDKTFLVHGDKEKMTEFIGNHPGEGFEIAENDKSLAA